MQPTNMGILKPALWHTPAITKDGIIRRAPDPRENHEGSTSRSPAANRASRGGPYRHGSPTLLLADRHGVPGCKEEERLGLCWGFQHGVYDVQALRHTSAHRSISSRRTPAFASLTRTHRNSVLNRESRRGQVLITCLADISHYFTPNLD